MKTLNVSADAAGAKLQTYHFTNDGTPTNPDMGYVLEAYSFVASSDTTTLTFSSVPDSNHYGPDGPVIDNVTVTETESPGANCKNGGWKTMTDNSGSPYNFKNQGACVSHFATRGDTPVGSWHCLVCDAKGPLRADERALSLSPRMAPKTKPGCPQDGRRYRR